MPNQIFAEPFAGKYDGVTPPTLLKKGWVSGGKNMRKVSAFGGWKPRKGNTIHNTTETESGTVVKSLHQYTNPKQTDYHFLKQINSKLYDATNNPPAEGGTTFGSDLGVAVGTTPGFSAVVGEWFVYADGSGRPIFWGGDNPYLLGFFVWDNSESVYVDFTREATDGRTTVATVLAAANDKIYVLTTEKCEGLVFDLGTGLNSNSVTMTIKAWRSGAWASVSSLSDGTADSGKSMAQDGTVTWTRSTSDTMRIIGDVMGYAYEISWSGALSGNVDVVSCKSKQDATVMTNKWNGFYDWISGARFYDQSATEYQECIGKVGTEATSQYIDISSATTSDYIYVKCFEPATALYLAVVIGHANVDNAQVDLIEYWDGDEWATLGTITDTTLDGGGDSSFSQSGLLSWNGVAYTSVKRTFEGDNIPGHWYRISWDVALSTDVRIYAITFIPMPETLPPFKGVVESKNRLFTWGGTEWPNRLRYSAKGRPDCFSGSDSGYTDAIGGSDAIVCALNFHNELIVFKESSVWLLEGAEPINLGYLNLATTVGLASPKAAVVAEVGVPTVHRDQAMSVAIWQDTDGIYISDGRKPQKVSSPFIDHYFDQEFSDCIPAASIANRQAFIDPKKNEYHLLLPTSELVYNYATNEWYPPWEREVDLTTGLGLRGTDNRYYSYGGTAGGRVLKLENDTTDKDASDVDVAISHSVKTRAITPSEELEALVFGVRQIWAEFKVRSSGGVTTKIFKDQASSGTTLIPALSMVKSGFNVTVPRVPVNVERCGSFQIEFSHATADEEMEVRGLHYELIMRGHGGV